MLELFRVISLLVMSRTSSRAGTLLCVRFDLDRLETVGTAAPVLDELSADINFESAQLDFSRSGMVLYRGADDGTQSGSVVEWKRADRGSFGGTRVLSNAAGITRREPARIGADGRRERGYLGVPVAEGLSDSIDGGFGSILSVVDA